MAQHRKTSHKTTDMNRLTTIYKSRYAFASILFSAILLLLSNLNGAHSLNCYHCSSVDNPECDEAFTGKANFTETNCDKYIDKPAKVCRKLVQYIEHKKVVIRSCGYIDEHDGMSYAAAQQQGGSAQAGNDQTKLAESKEKKSMCYKRSGTFAIMMESCNCYTDNCNFAAKNLVPNMILFTVLVLIASALTSTNSISGIRLFSNDFFRDSRK